MTDEDRAEAMEWGRRAGNAGMSPAVCPYKKTDDEYPVWAAAYRTATQQRIAHGGASPF